MLTSLRAVAVAMRLARASHAEAESQLLLLKRLRFSIVDLDYESLRLLIILRVASLLKLLAPRCNCLSAVCLLRSRHTASVNSEDENNLVLLLRLSVSRELIFVFLAAESIKAIPSLGSAVNERSLITLRLP